jgi:hypothetical protein
VSAQEKIEIIAEVPLAKEGNYQRTDEHAGDVRGNASGEWTVDENGEVEGIVFFLSPGALRRWPESERLYRCRGWRRSAQTE